eukprot:GHVR01103979.1.p1 GENE.GHVR01103979.1~~GHVR01103979.1.p1  ORF type:complete len:102 (+),score=13.87 GHVR01103979.1:493-798(+)
MKELTVYNAFDTPIIAASYKGHLDTVKILVENGSDVNYRNSQGLCALICASSGGHLNVVKYLIMNGANVNSMDNEGDTPLWWANHKGHLDVVKVLEEAGGK